MKAVRIILLGILVLFVVVIGGGFIFLKNFDVTKHKPQIISQATAALARPFDLKDIQLQVSLKEGIRLNLKDVTIGDDPNFQSGDFFKVSDVFVGVDVLALLKGTIAVSKVQVQSPQIIIIKTADGRMNAETIGKKSETAGAPEATQAAATGQSAGTAAVPAAPKEASSDNKSMAALPAIFVDSVNIDNATLQYIDRSFQPELNVTLDQLNLKVDGFSLNRPFFFDVAGRVFSAERNFKVSGKVQLNVAKSEVNGENINFTADLGKLALDQVRALPMLKGVPFPEVLQGQFQVNVLNLSAGAQGLGGVTANVSLTDGAVTVKEAAPGISFAASQIGVNVTNLSLNKDPFDFKIEAAYFSPQPNISLEGRGSFDMATQAVALKNTRFSTDLGLLRMAELRSSLAMLKDVPFPDLLAGQLNVTVKDLAAGPQGLGDLIADVKFSDGAVQMKIAEGMSFNASAIGLNVTGFSLTKPFQFSMQAAYLSSLPNIKVDGQAQVNVEQQVVSLQNTKIMTDLSSYDMEQLRAVMPGLKDVPLPESMAGKFNFVINEMTAGAQGLVSLVSQGELTQGMARLKELTVPVDPIRLKFTSTKTQLNFEDFYIGIGKGSIKASAVVDDYAGQQIFNVDLDLRGINLKEILKQDNAPVKVEGLILGQMKVQGQGFNPENTSLIIGDGGLEIQEGKLIDLNVLKLALSKITIIPNLADTLINSLPEPSRQQLQAKDTVFKKVEMKTKINQGVILIDPITLESDSFEFLGQVQAKFDQSFAMEGTLLIPPDLSKEMVALVPQLEYLVNPEQKIFLPLKVSGQGGSSPTFTPDIGYISGKILQNRGRQEIMNVLDKVLGQEEEAPAPGSENPTQPEKTPEREIIENIFDSIFK